MCSSCQIFKKYPTQHPTPNTFQKYQNPFQSNYPVKMHFLQYSRDLESEQKKSH